MDNKNQFLTESQIADIKQDNIQWRAVYGTSGYPRKEQERFTDKTKDSYREFVKELCSNAIKEELDSINNKSSDFYIILSEELESRK